jgi:Transient receptor ion channel II
VLSSKDPLLAAFELSSELAKLRKMENEFSEDYKVGAKIISSREFIEIHSIHVH